MCLLTVATVDFQMGGGGGGGGVILICRLLNVTDRFAFHFTTNLTHTFPMKC